MKCELSPVKDVPISFQERAAGESKLSKKQMIEYIFQLIELYLFVLKCAQGTGPAEVFPCSVATLVLLVATLRVGCYRIPRPAGAARRCCSWRSRSALFASCSRSASIRSVCESTNRTGESRAIFCER